MRFLLTIFVFFYPSVSVSDLLLRDLILHPGKRYLCDGIAALGWEANRSYMEPSAWDPRTTHVIEPIPVTIKRRKAHQKEFDVEISHTMKKLDRGDKSFCITGTGVIYCALQNSDGSLGRATYKLAISDQQQIRFLFNRSEYAASLSMNNSWDLEEIAIEVGTCREF